MERENMTQEVGKKKEKSRGMGGYCRGKKDNKDMTLRKK